MRVRWLCTLFVVLLVGALTMSKQPARRIKEVMQIDPLSLRVLADPIRSFVFSSVVSEAKTAKRLALEIGCPVTRLYYHLKQLEGEGLIFVEKTQRVVGLVEKHYRAVAKQLLLQRTRFAPGGKIDRRRSDSLLSFVFDQARLEVGERIADGRIDLLQRPPTVDSLLATRTVVRLDKKQAAELYSRLMNIYFELEGPIGKSNTEGKFYSVSFVLYPNSNERDSNDARGSSNAPQKTTGSSRNRK